MLPIPLASSGSTAIPSPHLIPSRSRAKVVLVASSDASLRERLRQCLTGLRWQVLEAPGGAEAWLASQAATQHLEALVVDPWLPDLAVNEFLQDFRRENPHVDLMMTDGTPVEGCPRSPYRQELLYALHRTQEGDASAWRSAPDLEGHEDSVRLPILPARDLSVLRDSLPSLQPVAIDLPMNGPSVLSRLPTFALPSTEPAGENSVTPTGSSHPAIQVRNESANRVLPRRETPAVERVPELVGSSGVMLEVSRRIRLVAARSTPVLIEGPTGSGKELVAEALHRLSLRARRPFVAINCAAIPEALLEAELFGHTRGAFTGAVQGRTGRIESANGGTLFLDEIGEIPLALQSKLLRFFESGELQRIGDNETVKVDVRIVAATHQPLADYAQKGLFRADLYYRLAVFLIRTPALVEHMDDLPVLVGHFLERMGRSSPVKRIDSEAMAKLAGHQWPGSVRELEHVLERAAILAGEEPVISAAEIDFGLIPVN
jgi:DNA-binding NtrC family response regulator